MVLEARAGEVLQIVVGRVVVRDLVEVREVHAGPACLLVHAEVGVVGQEAVELVEQRVRDRPRGRAGEGVQQPGVVVAGLEQGAGPGRAARFEVHDERHVLEPLVGGEGLCPQQPRLLAVGEEQDDRVAQGLVEQQEAGRLEDRGDPGEVVRDARAGADRVVVGGEQHGGTVLPTGQTRHEVDDVPADQPLLAAGERLLGGDLEAEVLERGDEVGSDRGVALGPDRVRPGVAQQVEHPGQRRFRRERAGARVDGPRLGRFQARQAEDQARHQGQQADEEVARRYVRGARRRVLPDERLGDPTIASLWLHGTTLPRPGVVGLTFLGLTDPASRQPLAHRQASPATSRTSRGQAYQSVSALTIS